MAGKRKKVVAKNYDELIKTSEERIEKLTSDLKSERANLKQLKKDKIRYDEQVEAEKKEKELMEITEIIANSGKTVDEIKKLLGENNLLKK